MPFDRLIKGVDEWAGRRGVSDVFAQIGPTDFRPRHVQWAKFLEVGEFNARMNQARVVVAHAGMGSILTALEMGKPILVMPRRGSLRETRNDHQVATAKRFVELGRVAVAFDEEELSVRLDELEALRAGDRIGGAASAPLIAALRAFIDQA
jgi:UDP-N-acetylglucosamine transferase subunit ALG13